MKRRHDYEFIDDNINKHLYCSICQDVFYKPSRTSCGYKLYLSNNQVLNLYLKAYIL